MPTKDHSMSAMPAPLSREGFAPLSARRLLVLGGIGLILVGMIFGDIFAVFVLHQNAGHVGSSLAGAALLPVGVFLIHYVGLAYSPLEAIGWASIFADLGGFLVIVACAGELFGLWKNFRARNRALSDALLSTRSRECSLLMAGGVLFVLLGFLHGGYYALLDLDRHEALDTSILTAMTSGAAAHDASAVTKALADYGNLQGDKAVKIAAHAHVIEFGLLAFILAFFQPYVDLSAKWKLRWAQILLLGSVMLPVCVLLEIRFGLVAGGLADFGGLLVILSLLGMWVGILRYTGHLDSPAGATR